MNDCLGKGLEQFLDKHYRNILNIIEFLTEQNKYITGSNIDINGGLI